MRISPFYYLIAAAVLIFLIKTIKRVSVSLLITYCFLVIATTVLSRSSQNTATINLTPFRLFQVGEWWMKQDLMLQIKANILMFVPIGFLIMQAGYEIKRKWIRILYVLLTILTGFLFSILIEYMQYRLHRGYCEADDVIHNTIGTVLGIAFYRIKSLIVDELKKRNIFNT